jgi:hypothetical protein
MISAPCKNCEDRSVFCHTFCERYKAFRDAKDRENEKLQKDRQVDYNLNATEVERGLKLKRRPRR